MKSNNFWQNKKSIFLMGVFTISIGILFLFPSIVDAAHPPENDSVTKSLVAGSNIVSIRDITNLMPQMNTTNLDTSTIKAGFITIIVEEFDANLDGTGVDIVLSSATSTSSGSDTVTTQLVETGVDTGVFTGRLEITIGPTTDDELQLGLSDGITVIYDPEPLGVSRLTADINVVSGVGTVELRDFIIDSSDKGFLNTCPFDAITHPVDFKLSPGVTANNIDLTISWANAELGLTPFNLGTFEIVYRPDPFTPYESLSRQTPAGPIDLSGTLPGIPTQTLTNVVQPSSGTIEGQYAIAVDLGGCVGGGGGGLVRPGLVVNVLAGSGSLIGLFTGGSGGGAHPTFGDSSLIVLENPTGGLG